MADAVVVTIDGVDRTSQVQVGSLDITNMMAAASTATFAINAGAYTPTAWDLVTITINGTLVFGGYMVERTVEGIGPGSSKQARWRCECRDYTALFDKVLINSVAFGATIVTDRTIVQYLFATYLAADGFDTASFVAECYYGVTIGFDNMTLRQALNKLASQVNAQWFVDCQQRVYWFSRYSPPNASLEIDTVTADGVTRFDSRPALTRQLDDSTIVNRLRVYGGWVQGEQTSNGFTATGSTTTFGPLTTRPHSVVQVSVQEGTGLSATRQLMTGDQIGYVPEHVLYTDGLTTNQREILVDRDAKTIQVAMGRPTLSPGRPPVAGAIVGVVFYQATAIAATVDDTVSQTAYGRVLEHQLYNPALLTTEQATQYGLTWLTKYGASQEHVTFDVDIFGLQPGTMLQMNAPTLGVTVPDLGILLQSGDDLLGQNDTFFAQEINGVVGRYVIQTVRYQAIPTVGGVQVRASVEAGEYEHTLLDMLKPVMTGQQAPALPVANQLSDLATTFGEIVAGRAVLTDGGTAAFTWDAYNAHTGVVVGLQPDYTLPQGAVLVLQGGTVKAKVGYLAGLGAVGTVTPSGWGIWTQNGYFQGVVAASTIIGGTVSGALVTGGTASFTAGSIGGFTIEANKIWSHGGTIQTGSVVNSSAPGVRMSTDGLFGYGTAGLTFALYSDPALKPWFSSGTILNTVYEINESAILRTGTSNPRVQIDSSGIFAYAPGTATTPKFSVDAATGLLTASDGIFSGSVNASQITGGTVSGGLVSGGTVSAAVFTGGTVNASYISGGTVSASYISGGTVNASYISGGTVSGGLISGGTVSGGLISGGTVNGAVISNGDVTLDSGGIKLENGTDAKFFFTNSGVAYSQIEGEDQDNIACLRLSSTTKIYLNGTVEHTPYGLTSNYGVGAGGWVPAQDGGVYLGAWSGHAWKGIVLKDQATATNYTLTINNGTVLIT